MNKTQKRTCEAYSWCIEAGAEHEVQHSSDVVYLGPNRAWWAWLAEDLDVPDRSAIRVSIESAGERPDFAGLTLDELRVVLAATATRAGREELSRLLWRAGMEVPPLAQR